MAKIPLPQARVSLPSLLGRSFWVSPELSLLLAGDIFFPGFFFFSLTGARSLPNSWRKKIIPEVWINQRETEGKGRRKKKKKNKRNPACSPSEQVLGPGLSTPSWLCLRSICSLM